MFLVAVNKVVDAKHYFRDIAPAVSKLAMPIGGVYVNELILTSDSKPIDKERAMAFSGPLTRIVIIYFESNEKFNEFWDSEVRRDIWLRGKSYAQFFDTAVQGGLSAKQLLLSADNQTMPEVIWLQILGLSGRESEVLYWIAQGKSNVEIADILELSVGTVKKHIANIFDKLGVKTRVAAVVLALETLGSSEPPLQILF